MVRVRNRLREVERSSTVFDSSIKLSSQDFLGRVIGHLQVLETCQLGVQSKVLTDGAYLSTSHDTGQVVISLEWGFMRFPNDGKGWCKTPESANGQFRCSRNANPVSHVHASAIISSCSMMVSTYNCRNALRSSLSYDDMISTRFLTARLSRLYP